MNYVDVAFTYEREQEELSVTEGWAVDTGCVFHDHFCLVGPSVDPAKIRNLSSVYDAFAQIAEIGCLFHSRADGSATMHKERSIWRQIQREPWLDASAVHWYKTSSHTPSDALIDADAAGAYLLVDRSTLLSQTIRRMIKDSTVYFEPTSPDHVLMNSCHAIYATRASGPVLAAIVRFLTYVQSPRGQRHIAEFGRGTSGKSLFSPVVDGLAEPELRGGYAREGRWWPEDRNWSRL